MQALKNYYQECVRVLTVTKKPTRIEYMTIAKVAGIGILIIGLLGFVIFSIAQLIIPYIIK
ncbi:MAG TPA: protein translocase SEC61 complex subunit gamma [Acidobacteriota bacterium]|nr:protein translocase SEC61 complex subunit gamma [Acidobacteriota bacterium]